MGGSLTKPNRIKDVYKKIVFYDDNKFKVDNGSSDVVITSAENFSGDTEQTLVNKTIDADNNTISNLEVDNLKSGVLDTDLSSVASTDTTLPSAKAVKTYVDALITAQDLDFQADTGGALSIDLDSESLLVSGGTGIDTSGSGNTITVAVDNTIATKTYVDSQVTAQDLDFQADTGGTLSIDLDSESFRIAGGTGIDTSGATNTLTVAIDSTVATLTGTQTLTNKTIDVDNNTLSNIEVDNLKSGVLDTDLTTVAATDTTLASAKAIKTYVDAQVTAQDLDFQGDTGGVLSIDLDSESLTVSGGTGVSTSGSGNTITVNTVDSEIDHDSLNNYDSDEHVAHSFVTLTAGAGLTADSGGNIAASRSFAVGAGTGIIVNTNDVSVDTSVIATRTYVDSQVSTVNTLGEMTDVTLSSLANGDLLQYNSSSSQWNNTNEIDGGPFTGS